MLLIFTLIYAVVFYFLPVEAIISFGIYIVGIATLKGVLCKELKDVFNLRKASSIYKATGLADSIVSFLSLVIMLTYYLGSGLVELDIATALVFALSFIILYRFIFWNVATTLRKIYTKTS